MWCNKGQRGPLNNFGGPGFLETLFMYLGPKHGLRTPREEIAFTTRPKIHSHSQIFRYGRSIFCLPHRPNFSDIFDLCPHWLSVVRGWSLQNFLIRTQRMFLLKAHMFVYQEHQNIELHGCNKISKAILLFCSH